jgi:hypothetical protein
MKAEVKVPKGWYRVKRGKFRRGDEVTDWLAIVDGEDPGWYEIANSRAGEPIDFNEFVIRRRPAKRKATR